jgi:hypothetical protein
MVWWPFATKPERADTPEVTDLHSGAPPLYSTHFVVESHFDCLFRDLAWVQKNLRKPRKLSAIRSSQRSQYFLIKNFSRRPQRLCGEFFAMFASVVNYSSYDCGKSMI